MQEQPVSARDSLVKALGDPDTINIEGRPDNPTLPLVGSENVPISKEEEKTIE